MSLNENLFQTKAGKSALISSFVSAILLLLIFLLPLAPYNEDAWYSGLYLDLNLPDKDRFNGWLVALEILFIIFFFFYLSVALGNFAEVRNELPGWKEIIFPGISAFIFALFVPKISITGDIEGTQSDKGFHHFTPDMQQVVFWVSLLFIILFSLYFMYTEKSDSD